jgi:hypothetical protein
LLAATVVAAGANDRVPLAACAEATDANAELNATVHREIFIVPPMLGRLKGKGVPGRSRRGF